MPTEDIDGRIGNDDKADDVNELTLNDLLVSIIRYYPILIDEPATRCQSQEVKCT